jgi:hypothetical protein
MTAPSSTEIMEAHRVRVAAARVVDAEPFVLPEPEVRAHVVTLTKEEHPQGVRNVANRAAKAGFRVVVSHARGPWINANGTAVLRICDSLLVKMEHPDGRRCVGLWITQVDPEEWGLECMFLLVPWLQKVTSAELSAYLKTPLAAEPEESAIDALEREAVVDLDAYDVA